MVSLKLRCWQVQAGWRAVDDDKEREKEEEEGPRASDGATETPSMDRNSVARVSSESSATFSVVTCGIDFKA